MITDMIEFLTVEPLTIEILKPLSNIWIEPLIIVNNYSDSEWFNYLSHYQFE